MAEDVRSTLREAYDRKAHERDTSPPPPWQAEERDIFLALLQHERKRSVLEVGAATGADGKIFADHGFKVVCTDLSPEMVRRCQVKGLTAYVMDIADLQCPADSFEAIYAMNCLVHVPKAELPTVLREVSRVLTPLGLFYVGVYGGYEHEGSGEWDPYEPKRFFSFYTDEHLRRVLEGTFDVHTFRRIPHGWAGLHFQSVILRRVGDGPWLINQTAQPGAGADRTKSDLAQRAQGSPGAHGEGDDSASWDMILYSLIRQSSGCEHRLCVPRDLCARHLPLPPSYPDIIDIPLANMDGPIDRVPESHLYFDDRASWTIVADDLPRLGGPSGLEPEE